MTFSTAMWILYAVSLLMCCMGFFHFVWFMSVGYGLSVAGIGAALLIMSLVNGQCSVFFFLQCAVMIVYGVRLGGFVLIRELKNETYRQKLRQVGGDAKIPVPVMFVMWLCLGALYLCQSAAPVFRLTNSLSAKPDALAWIGLVISMAGVVLETLADRQKGEQKKLRPDMPAMDGLYRLCRCPNYLGEMIFWTGIFVSGLAVLSGWQWLAAIFGFVCIIGIMVSGAKRVEGRHIRNYGKNPVYRNYADTVPLLLPFTHLYHMTTPEQVAKEDAAKAAKKEGKGK